MKTSENKWLSLAGLGIILVASFGQLQRFQLGLNLAVYLQDCLALIWLIWFWLAAGKPIWRWRQLQGFFQQYPEVFYSLIWILLGWCLALIQAGTVEILLRPLAYLARLLVVLIFSLKLKNVISQTWSKFNQKILAATTLMFGWLILLWGLLQYFFIPDTRFLKTFGWDDHYFRLISSLFDPGFAGLVLSLSLLGWLSWAKNQLNSQVWQRLVWPVGIGLFGLGILLTYSRASYLAIGIGLGWLVWRNWRQHQVRQIWWPMITLVMLIGGSFFLPHPTGEGVNLQRTSTIIARLDTNQLAIKSLTPSQWWLGKGLFVSTHGLSPSQTNLPDHAQIPDNLAITFLTGIGIGGILIGGKLWFKKLKLCWLSWPTWLQSLWLAVLTHSLFNNSLFQPQIWLLILIWTMAAVALKPKADF